MCRSHWHPTLESAKRRVVSPLAASLALLGIQLGIVTALFSLVPTIPLSLPNDFFNYAFKFTFPGRLIFSTNSAYYYFDHNDSFNCSRYLTHHSKLITIWCAVWGRFSMVWLEICKLKILRAVLSFGWRARLPGRAPSPSDGVEVNCPRILEVLSQC